jgi:hypothetical protein
MAKLTPEQRDNEARNVIRKVAHRSDAEIIEWCRGWLKWPKFDQTELDRLRNA